MSNLPNSKRLMLVSLKTIFREKKPDRKSPTMRRVLAHPLFWLTLQIALTTVFLSAAGKLEPQRVPDTRSYEDCG